MKKIVYFIATLSLIISCLIGAYIFSSDVRFFVQWIKHWPENVSPQPLLTDEYTVFSCNTKEYEEKIRSLESQILALQMELSDAQKSTQWDFALTPSWEIEVVVPEEDYSEHTKIVFDAFWWENFQEKEYDDFFKIFSITDEFPGKYLTYNTSNFEIYFFVESSYEELYSFFDIVSYDFPFSLNQTNSFWRRSFFINLDQWDDFVRLIIENEKKVFGLKIQKNYYNQVKQVLETL